MYVWLVAGVSELGGAGYDRLGSKGNEAVVVVVVVGGEGAGIFWWGKGDFGAGARRHGDCFCKGWRSRFIRWEREE